MSAHQLEVEVDEDQHQVERVRAVCSCGYRSVWSYDREAIGDGRRHAAQAGRPRRGSSRPGR